MKLAFPQLANWTFIFLAAANVLSAVVGSISISYAAFAVAFFILLMVAAREKTSKKVFIRFILLEIVLAIFIILHIMKFGYTNVLYQISIFASSIMGFCLSRFVRSINTRLLAIGSMLFFCGFIVSLGVEKGGAVEEVLNRTYYSSAASIFILLHLFNASIALLKQELSEKKYIRDFLMIFALFTVMSFISFSRSGYILGCCALLITAFIHFRSMPLTLPRLFQIMALLAVIVVGVIATGSGSEAVETTQHATRIGQQGYTLLDRFQERGLDTGRYDFWSWYFSSMSFDKFLLGRPATEMWKALFDGAENTLHSSFFQLHMFVGFAALVITIGFFKNLVHLVMLLRRHRSSVLFVALSALILCLARASYDTVLFAQRYDFVSFSILFSSLPQLVKSPKSQTQNLALSMSLPVDVI